MLSGTSTYMEVKKETSCPHDLKQTQTTNLDCANKIIYTLSPHSGTYTVLTPTCYWSELTNPLSHKLWI